MITEVVRALDSRRLLIFHQQMVTLKEIQDGLRPAEVKEAILRILQRGVVDYTMHALQRMKQRRLRMTDCIAALRGGWSQPAHWEEDAWRYRIFSKKVCCVVELVSEMKLKIVTVWRLQ